LVGARGFEPPTTPQAHDVRNGDWGQIGVASEGSPAPVPLANDSILRKPDFVSQSPSTPRNSASPSQP